MNRDDGVLAIVLAAEHLFRFAGVDLRGEIVERPDEVVADGLTGFRPFDEDGEIVDLRAQRLAQRAIFVEPAAALQQLLRGLLVLPEVRIGDSLFYFREFVGGTGGVKDSSAGRRRGARDPRTCEAVRRVESPLLSQF
jgi:hypothetical protein